MKTYSAPQLVSVASVVDATRAFSIGVKDPQDENRLTLGMTGSIGFQL
jgi:hypothetical protein